MGQRVKITMYKGTRSKTPCVKCGYTQPKRKLGRPLGSKNKKK